MFLREAINILENIRENIETPIPELTRTGWAVTALSKGIRALEKMEKAEFDPETDADEILSKLTCYQERIIYDRLHYNHVKGDVESYIASELDKDGSLYKFLQRSPVEKRFIVSEAAWSFVNGDYECNLPYWANIESSIKNAVEQFKSASIVLSEVTAGSEGHFCSLIKDYKKNGFITLEKFPHFILMRKENEVIFISY